MSACALHFFPAVLFAQAIARISVFFSHDQRVANVSPVTNNNVSALFASRLICAFRFF